MRPDETVLLARVQTAQDRHLVHGPRIQRHRPGQTRHHTGVPHLETAFRSTAAAFIATQLIACGGAPFALDPTLSQIPNPIDAGSEASTSRDAQGDRDQTNPIDAGSDASTLVLDDGSHDAGPPTRYLRDGAACYEVQNELAKCGSDMLTIPTDYCASGSVVVDGVPTQCQCTDTYNCACVVAAYAAVGEPFACACNQGPDGVITFGCK